MFPIANYGKVNLIITFLKKDKIQDKKANQLNLEVHHTYKRHEKITKSFEPSIDEDVINKAYLDEKFFKLYGHLSLSEKDYNEVKSQYNKQSLEEILFQRAVKTAINILYVKIVNDKFPMMMQFQKKILLVTRSRPDLKEVNDTVIQ